MKTRLLSVLLVFLLITAAAVPAVSADETQVITITGVCKNTFGGSVANCKLSAWFDYDSDSRPHPHVVECGTEDESNVHECHADYKIVDYPQNATRVVSKHTVQAHPHLDAGILGSVGFHTPRRTCKLYIECKKDGTTSCGKD